MSILELIKTLFDFFHLVDIFHRALFARRDNQPLLTLHQRHFCDLRDGDKILRLLGSLSPIVDEGSETIILAEIAARAFVARGTVFDLANRIKANKGSLQAITPQAQ